MGWGARGGGHGAGGTGAPQGPARQWRGFRDACHVYVLSLSLPLPSLFHCFLFQLPFSLSLSLSFPLSRSIPARESREHAGPRWTGWSQLPPRPWEMLYQPNHGQGWGCWSSWCSGKQFPLRGAAGWDETPPGCHWEPWPAGVAGSSGATTGDPVGDTVGAVGAPRRRP